MDSIVVTLKHTRDTKGYMVFSQDEPKMDVYVPKGLIKGETPREVEVTIKAKSSTSGDPSAEEPVM